MIRIALNAEHGYNTAGKRVPACIPEYEDTREWWLNNRVLEYVQKNLANYDCEWKRLDDETGATDVSLSERAKTANKYEADVIITIAHNAGINGGSGGGTVVSCYPKLIRYEQANLLYDSIVDSTCYKGNRSVPIQRTEALYIIRETKAPSFHIEVGYMDSLTDMNLIMTTDFHEKVAHGIVDWLIDVWGLEGHEEVDNTCSCDCGCCRKE